MTTKLKSMTEYEKSTRDFAYFGNHGDWLMAYTSANCSDIVTRANFIALQRALPEDSFIVEDFKGPLSGVHGGWVLLNPDNTEAVATAERILTKLEDYPVIDDEVWSELEYDEACQSAEAACDIDRSRAALAASYIVSYALEDGSRDLFDFWPTEREVFFGYLAFRRYDRRVRNGL